MFQQTHQLSSMQLLHRAALLSEGLKLKINIACGGIGLLALLKTVLLNAVGFDSNLLIDVLIVTPMITTLVYQIHRDTEHIPCLTKPKLSTLLWAHVLLLMVVIIARLPAYTAALTTDIHLQQLTSLLFSVMVIWLLPTFVCLLALILKDDAKRNRVAEESQGGR